VIDRFEAKAAPLCLSLDFGTTTSCVAVIKPDKEGKFKRDLNSLNIIPLEFSDPFWKLPSLICRRGDKGKEIAFCGQDAKRLKAESKATKRLMVKAIPKNEKDSNCEDGKCIMEAALRRAREWFIEQPRVTEILSNKIIMSVPTSFPLAWKRILSEVCREAANKVFGSKDVSIIEESMAAMSYYLYRERGDKTFPFIIICDFGGGSTDITFLEKEEKGLYLPIKHGGMHSFASNQIDELIIEAFRDSCELTRDQAKTLKENLDTFANFKNELHRLEKRDDIFIRDKWETLQDRIREAIENRFSTCFKEMLQRIKNKWDQNKWEMIQTSKCLILLAGDGSNLAGFRDYIRRAWELTIRKLQMRMDSVEIIQIREPKRCVAIGSFLAYYYHGEEFSEKKITNDVPEDILLHIPPAFEPSDNRRIYDIGGERYYRLFEEGQPLNTDNKVSTIIPLVDTGKTLVKESITFNLFSGLIGDKIEEYLDGKLIPPVDTSMQRLRFTYQAEGADVKIEWVK
jgi:actin-like ATPase involved in cell morphogenesis